MGVMRRYLARSLPGGRKGYLNWDVADHRERILRRRMPDCGLWVLDEIHRYRSWRNHLEGLYDGRREGQRILVTGSARLEHLGRGGDSLQGRYHLLRLHPLSLAELGKGSLGQLMRLGGFPEPFLSGSVVEARRWSRENRTLLVREEIAGLERVVDLGNLELPALLLHERVGSPAPFGARLMRAVKKEREHYHLDWSIVPGDGPRFENLVACHLLKWVHHRQAVLGLDLELCCFRDRDGREVDFVVTGRRVPVMLVECRSSGAAVDRGREGPRHGRGARRAGREAPLEARVSVRMCTISLEFVS